MGKFSDIPNIHPQLTSALAYLIDLHDYEDNHEVGGICTGLRMSCADGMAITTMLTLMKQWPQYSGNPTFPVPAPTWYCKSPLGVGDPIRDSVYFYRACQNSSDFENNRFWLGEYGELRLAMIEYMIERILDDTADQIYRSIVVAQPPKM